MKKYEEPARNNRSTQMRRFSTLKCPNCGANVDSRNRFCDYCGSEILLPRPNVNQTTVNHYYSQPEKHEQGNASDGLPRAIYIEKKRGCFSTGFTVLGIVSFIIIVLMFKSCFSGVPSERKTTSEITKTSSLSGSVWADSVTPLSDFEYYIDSDEIYIKKYRGSGGKVKIANYYNVDGTICYVAGLEGATFLFKDIDSCILPETVKSVEGPCFNSCGVKFVYLPASLVNVPEYFWGYFHDAKKIYYGGTKEQWQAIFTIDRGDLDVEEVKFEAEIDDLK